MAVILGNPAIIEAYQSGIPANGKPVPDGAKMAKVRKVRTRRQISAAMTAVARETSSVVYLGRTICANDDEKTFLASH
jgi:hypothetical protein